MLSFVILQFYLPAARNTGISLERLRWAPQKARRYRKRCGGHWRLGFVRGCERGIRRRSSKAASCLTGTSKLAKLLREPFRELVPNVVEVLVKYAIDSKKVAVAPSELEPRGDAKTGITLLEFTEEVSPSKGRISSRKKQKAFFNIVLHRKHFGL